jgi:hypothetical protein
VGCHPEFLHRGMKSMHGSDPLLSVVHQPGVPAVRRVSHLVARRDRQPFAGLPLNLPPLFQCNRIIRSCLSWNSDPTPPGEFVCHSQFQRALDLVRPPRKSARCARSEVSPSCGITCTSPVGGGRPAVVSGQSEPLRGSMRLTARPTSQSQRPPREQRTVWIYWVEPTN